MRNNFEFAFFHTTTRGRLLPETSPQLSRLQYFWQASRKYFGVLLSSNWSKSSILIHINPGVSRNNANIRKSSDYATLSLNTTHRIGCRNHRCRLPPGGSRPTRGRTAGGVTMSTPPSSPRLLACAGKPSVRTPVVVVVLTL